MTDGKFENCQPKPARCGCGGEAEVIKHTFHGASPSYGVECTNCHTESWQFYKTETEAIQAWNTAMGAKVTFKYEIGRRSGKTLARAIDFLRRSGWLQEHDRILTESAEPERTAKVIEHDASITDDHGYKYQRSEYLCDACKKKVIGGDEYCSHCGCRLDWNEDIPMEYFENGGI